MRYTLDFSHFHRYKGDSITIPAVLKLGEETVRLLAKLDTGASDCLFQHSYAEALGLRVEDGDPQTFSTANSRFSAYGHEVSIWVLDIEVTARAYFFADPGIKRNVLGRRGWLDRVRLGLVDYEQKVYLSSYNG